MSLFWDIDQMRSANMGPDILAEGDSWFSYWLPGNGNLLNKIDRKFGQRYGILSLAATGDQAREVFKGNSRDELISYLKTYNRKIKILMFSGGGNDITRDRMIQMLHSDCSKAKTLEECFKRGQPTERLNEINAAYGELVILRDLYCKNATIITHNYDYAIPNGRGVFKGSLGWLKPPMDFCKVPTQWRRKIVAAVIDGMEGHLVARSDAKFRFVKTSGTLEEGDWANELHPNSEGFGKVARKFIPVLSDILDPS